MAVWIEPEGATVNIGIREERDFLHPHPSANDLKLKLIFDIDGKAHKRTEMYGQHKLRKVDGLTVP